MTRGSNSVRRLYTRNPQNRSNDFHTTEWLWYWQDEFKKWNLYGYNSNGQKSGGIDSVYLEQKFLNNAKDVVEFTIGSQSYSLSFQDMIQTNKRYGTKRLVITRPRFVSAADFQLKNDGKPQNIPIPVPDTWDKTKIPQTGYSKISLLHTSTEFKTIEALFHKTMRSFDIICIKRIQNKALWEVYQWQKNLMKINNGGLDVTENQLFHGTGSENVDAICTNNFDWRICGTHGTLYGKGSYFARDASYSHRYTGATSVKTVFVSRVLVGSYTKGDPGYIRPPSKDGGNTNFYDSCVDNIINPSVFVLFEKHQIYPEYLLEYKDHSANKTFSTQSLLPPAASTGQSNPKPLPMPPSNLRSKSKSLPNLNKKSKKPCVTM